MPRNSNGEYYLPPGTAAVKDEVAYSAHVNQRFEDLKADANTPRPVLYGGTGAGSASAARTNLGVRAATDTPSLAGANVFAGANTFAGATVFNGVVDISRAAQTKLRLMGGPAAEVEAYNETGTRTGRIAFNHTDGWFRATLDASGSQPSAQLEMTRAGVLSVNGNAVYHTGNKPTPADVGALPASGKAVDAGKLDGLDSTAFARSARTVTGGTAMTGGGALTGNVTINADVATEAEAVGTANDKVMTPLRTRQAYVAHATTIPVGAVGGPPCLMSHTSGTEEFFPGDVRSGATLRYAAADGSTASSPTPTGTWECCGYAGRNISSNQNRTTIWRRIA